jgi:hypothetical protein
MVGDVVALMRASSRVFYDRDSIALGQNWLDVIMNAIAECEMFMLMWCGHARDSKMIQREWRRALECKKAIAPVLLDETPVPEELEPYQWLDLRILRQAHSKLEAEDGPATLGARQDWTPELYTRETHKAATLLDEFILNTARSS